MDILTSSPDKEAGAESVKKWRGGYGWINGRWRVLELAVDIRKAAPGKGGRCLPIGMLRSSRPKGGSTTPTKRRTVATGRAAWSGGNDPHDRPPPENHVRRVLR
jgi:hypothetical protein